MINEEKTYRGFEMLTSRAAYFDDQSNSIWFVTAYGAFLLRISVETNRIIESYEIPFVDTDKEYSFISLLYCDNKLLLVPYNERNIIIFNIKEQSFECMKVDYDIRDVNLQNRFREMLLFNDWYYLIGYQIHSIYKISRISGNSECIKMDDEDGLFCVSGVIMKGNKLYIPMYEKAIVVMLDLIKGSYEKKEIETSDRTGFVGIVEFNELIMLISRKGDIILCDEHMREVKRSRLDYTGDDGSDIVFRAVAYNQGVYCFGLINTNIWYISNESVIEDLKFDYPHLNEALNENSKYEMIVSAFDALFFQIRTNGALYRINSDQKIEECKLELDKKLINRIRNRFMNKKQLFLENNITGLEGFINYITEEV